MEGWLVTPVDAPPLYPPLYSLGMLEQRLKYSLFRMNLWDSEKQEYRPTAVYASGPILNT